MNRLHLTAILLTAFVAVFLQARLDTPRLWLGTQIDLLPVLVVYTALSGDIFAVAIVATCGGLWFDSLSFNALGISVLPLFAAGLLVQFFRDLILRDQPYAQFVVGLMAGAAVPAMTLLALLGARQNPAFGWGSLWQWAVMGLMGGILTPVCFRFFDAVNRAFSHPQMIQSSFRPDRVIERGPMHDARH